MTGRFTVTSFSAFQAHGALDPEALVVVDFVRMGRSPTHARRGLAETIWQLRKTRGADQPLRLTVVMPARCGGLGEEPDLTDTTPRWSEDHGPIPARCDYCAADCPVPTGWVGAVIPGPTFQGVRFAEFICACCACSPRPLADLLANRERLLTVGVEEAMVGWGA